MKPHYNLVRDLIRKHVRMVDMFVMFEDKGVRIDLLFEIEPFTLAMDIIGFPPDIDDNLCSERGFDGSERYNRYKLAQVAHCIKQEEVDAFVDRLYAEYDKLLQKRPHLKRGPEASSAGAS